MFTTYVGILLLVIIPSSFCFIDNLYCGEDNCYELLDVDRDVSKQDLTKAYRKLARKWHPDMHKGKEAKEKAAGKFQKIANAYDVLTQRKSVQIIFNRLQNRYRHPNTFVNKILKDEESKKDYDYMLDHPEEYYSHYYRYYRRRMAPKVDVRIVIVVTITIISGIQYWSAWNNYNDAIKYLTSNQKYRMQATHIAKEQGLLNNKKKKDRTKTKEEIKEEEEAILRKIIEEKMDIKGSYEKPKITDILWIQLFFFPYYIMCYIYWYVRWVWKFTICGEPFTDEEKLYLIRKNFGLSQGKFDALQDHEKEEFLEQELWVKEKYLEYKREKEEEQKAALSQSGRYKMYRRYMKKGGPGQMQMGPE